MIIDLFCGIGRFEREGVTIVSIDFDPKTKPTILADIRFLPLRARIRPDLVHASPPCTYFSYARLGSGWGYNYKGIGESLELVAACFKAYDYLDAKYWTLENPLGYLGKLLNQVKITYSVADYDKKATHFWSNMRGLRRSIIPQDVRQRILDEVFK